MTAPNPVAKTGLVEHILYLGGRGRETPYTSTSESESVADHFAGKSGRVWETTAGAASSEGAKHLARLALLQSLRGFGKGKAKWDDAFEVAQAARYVEEWSEHILDWSGAPPAQIAASVAKVFRRGSR